MIRLILVTVAAMFAVMMLWGDPGARTAVQPPAPETTPEPEAPAPEAVAAPTAAGPVPEPVQQTAPQATRFPGPALRPSPEYADQAPVAAEQAAVPEGAGTILYVTGNRVNFRAGPSTGDAVVGALLKGSPVRATGPARGGWLPILDAQGRAGFMSEQFLSADQP